MVADGQQAPHARTDHHEIAVNMDHALLRPEATIGVKGRRIGSPSVTGASA
jgi:hypothetical protein